MTRKDYQLIAAALRLARTTNPTSKAHRIALADAAIILARELANDNPRFDRARFLAACCIEE